MVNQIDVTGLSYFMPIFGFLFVFVIVYAVVSKTKILGESSAANIMSSLVVAIIFITFASAQEYVQKVTPWFVILVIVLFFVLILVGLSQQKVEAIVRPWFVWVLIVALILVFLIAAIKVFSTTLDPLLSDIRDFIDTEDRILGAVILLVIAGIASWILTKGK